MTVSHKKSSSRKSSSRKSSFRKASSRKASSRKASSRKASSRKSSFKKSSSRKASSSSREVLLINDGNIIPTANDESDKKKKHIRADEIILVDLKDKENIQPREYSWGLGVEHEMQIFHVPPAGMGEANILFDSQEATCYLTGDSNEEGACCKMKKKCSKSMPEKDRPKLTDDELKWLLSMDWELTGRQSEGCEDGNIILPRTPVLMPELITGSFKNRSIESIFDEIVYLEDKYIELQMRNPKTQEKVKKYGPLKTHACNFLSDIKVPIRPTINSPEYKFNELKKYKDYLGSYHITITLPHFKGIPTDEFVNMHRFFGMQFQWIEPLFNGIYFSPDPDSVGKGPNKVQGSGRIMIVGWGNLGGSDLRKLGQTKKNKKVPFDAYGIGRATNIKSYWREQLEFDDTKKLNLCAKTAPPSKNYSKYPKKALSIHTSDIRTFATAESQEECIKKGSNPNDCPRIDAAPMEPPFGMELRIFDHFDVQYLLDLMRVVVLLAANAQRHNPTKYVYKNQTWINAVGVSMKQGWNGILPREYLNELRRNLGLELKVESLRLDHVYSSLVKELYQLNHSSQLCKMMMNNPEIEPKVPSINRYCWELSFNKEFNKPIIDFIKNTYKTNSTHTLQQFKTDFFKVFEEYLWRDNIEDLLYALETNKKVLLKIQKGKIQTVKILL